MLTYIIGGSKGIGAAIGSRLAKCGNIVYSLSRTPMAPPNVYPLYFDLAADNVKDLLLSHFSLTGVPQRIIISGGMGAYIRADKVEPEIVDKLYKTNQRGPIICTETAMVAMRLEHLEGRIILIGSTVTEHGAHGLEVYSWTKSHDGFIKSICRHAAQHNIGIMGLNVGWVNTDMTKDIEPKLKSAIEKSIPLGRMADTEEIAQIACDMIGWPIFAAGSCVSVAGGVS